jgi:NAD(P)-dependent dehydrogenase (short-subunit alcohol dehydrogenase family)
LPSDSLITTPFDHDSTADEVIAGVDLSGQRALVTGSASGIGVETARALASAGAEVTLAVRNLDAGRAVADEIATRTGNKQVSVAALELTDPGSIAALVDGWRGPLNILVNNAGIMALPELTRTAEGWEIQFATNHLGHFALALGLHDALTAAGNARVVSVSSNVHLRSDVVFDDINYQTRPYEPWGAYGQSKTANVLFAVEAAARWATDGITVNALMPGGIKTGLDRYQTSPQFFEAAKDYPYKTIAQGAATSVLLAGSPLMTGVTGRYFEDNNQAPVTDDPDAQSGVRAYALDPAAAARLWDVSLNMLAER